MIVLHIQSISDSIQELLWTQTKFTHIYLDTEQRLTHCTDKAPHANIDLNPYSCGQPPFIIQEEFSRYSGYEWAPRGKDGATYILYEEVDSSMVPIITIPNYAGESRENI